MPSQTELLYDLGLEEQVTGITKFCVHPASWFRAKTRVGGTKAVKAEIIHRLDPDLILANKEENVQEQVEALGRNYPVWTSDIHDLPASLQMIRSVGVLTGKSTEAAAIAGEIALRFDALQAATTPLRVCYLIWKDPYMTIGHDTFIHDMLHRCGWVNIFGERQRYPTVTPGEIRDAGCELLLLSSEPYPFKQKHIDEIQPLLPGVTIMLADGEMFSWYGSRLLHAAAYFERLNSMTVKT